MRPSGLCIDAFLEADAIRQIRRLRIALSANLDETIIASLLDAIAEDMRSLS